MQDTQQHTTDPSLIACRVLDVQQALQNAFADFASQEDNSLDTLALLIQQHLGDVPAFLLTTPAQDPPREG